MDLTSKRLSGIVTDDRVGIVAMLIVGAVAGLAGQVVGLAAASLPVKPIGMMGVAVGMAVLVGGYGFSKMNPETLRSVFVLDRILSSAPLCAAIARFGLVICMGWTILGGLLWVTGDPELLVTLVIPLPVAAFAALEGYLERAGGTSAEAE